MKVLVFGGSGLLGTTLCRKLAHADHTVTAFKRTPDNPCHTEAGILQAFDKALQQAQPDCVINLIAATNVDMCEKDMGHAALLNSFVPHAIGQLCRNHNTRVPHFIQISSDQVYDGVGPHTENITRPINTYALTKLVGEYPALHGDACVLRTNFFGKSETPHRTSFSDWLVNNAKSGTPLNVFDDVYFSPLGLTSLCAAIMRVMDIRLTGLYNLGSQAEGISKAAMARLMLQCTGLDTSILNVVSVNSASLLAPRPKDMRMDSSAFAKATSLPTPTIEQEIQNEAQHYA